MRGIRDELSRVSTESYSWVRSNLQRTVQHMQGAGMQGAGSSGGGGGGGGSSVHRGLQQGSAAVAHAAREAGGVLKAAARGLKTALNGPSSGRSTPAAGAATPPAEEETPRASAAALPAGGSSSSLASSVSSQQPGALPTTALRWMASGKGGDGAEGEYVGSGAALGLPQEGGAAAGGGGGGGGDDLIKL